ncbi:hypothetical protein PFISCL1PPCAC_22302 [Pristionchus fissidentatus]|uniref:Uncharacterized protein n=1 Tax=Pristionchus fissidentatus TaxID=1538716 RepID=A0AAV5WKD5_9BILA|nr:hypothetical protein PFISCL1PPCAC_22302 [Pristionchus fissidentatus]
MKCFKCSCLNARFVLVSKKEEEKTDWMACIKCSYVANTVSAYISRLKKRHSVTPTEMGLSFECLVCGHTSRSKVHEETKKCPNARFTVVRDDEREEE